MLHGVVEDGGRDDLGFEARVEESLRNARHVLDVGLVVALAPLAGVLAGGQPVCLGDDPLRSDPVLSHAV